MTKNQYLFMIEFVDLCFGGWNSKFHKVDEIWNGEFKFLQTTKSNDRSEEIFFFK